MPYGITLLTVLFTFICKVLCIAVAIFFAGLIFASTHFFIVDGRKLVSNCKLYLGKVKHSRIKGGAQHYFEYPIFFSYIDLQQIRCVGYTLWPIFVSNDSTRSRKLFSFCSLDSKEHLKHCDENCNTNNLYDRCLSFVSSNNLHTSNPSVRLLTHLTYFGYCFNPVSFFYLFDANNDGKIHSVVTEVSNTPWIEQYPYILHESIKDVDVLRRSRDNDYCFEARWDKAFHVSPFMEMDYIYNFKFGYPGESLKVIGRMLKKSSNELWFSASFDVKAIEFSPLNLCYVLIWYPLHTRTIQLLIHWEALKLFLKGIPVFDHPEGTDVDFGFGVTGNRLKMFGSFICSPFLYLNYLIRENVKRVYKVD